MDSNTPSESIEKQEETIDNGKVVEELPPAKSEESPADRDVSSSVADDGKTGGGAAETNDGGNSDDSKHSENSDEAGANAPGSSHEDYNPARDASEQTSPEATSKPKRLSRLAENDKPPEDPKFRFLSDPERDGKGVAAADDVKDAKDDPKQKDGERKNRKKVSRIPSARRGNRASGQCENCGGCQNARRSYEDPAGDERRDRNFQRNTRERNSYPGPRRQDTGPDDQQKWGHAMYYELYGEEQKRPQRPRRRGRGEYHGGGNSRDFNNNNNKDDHRSEGNDGRHNNNRRPDSSSRSDRFGAPRRQNNHEAGNAEKHEEDPQRNRENCSNGERGARRGQGSFRGRGSFRRRNNQKQPSSDKNEGEAVPAAVTA